MRRVLALVFVLVSSRLVVGQGLQDGHQMLRECEVAEAPHASGAGGISMVDLQDAVHCLAYVQGFREAEHIHEQAFGNNASFCVPADTSNGDVVLVLIKHLKILSPRDLNQSRAFLVFRALMVAYPCRKRDVKR